MQLSRCNSQVSTVLDYIRDVDRVWDFLEGTLMIISWEESELVALFTRKC